LRTHDTRAIDPNTVNAERGRIESGATTRQVVDAMLWSPTHLGRIKQQQVRRQTNRNPTAVAKTQRRCTVVGETTNRIGQRDRTEFARPMPEEMKAKPGIIKERQVRTRIGE
jgi:hypothetical protein